MISILNNLFCPNCKVDLKDTPIPPYSQHQYNNTHISKAIGIMGGGNIIGWICPICDFAWENKDVEDNTLKEEVEINKDINETKKEADEDKKEQKDSN